MKYNDNGEYKDIYVKSFDTLPVGTEVDYDGQTVPSGWTEVDDEPVYSETEQVCGTWVDGKPLYRKVLTDTSTTSGDHNISISNTNYDFVMLESWCIRTSNYIITNWGSGGANDFCNSWINTNTKNVIYNLGSSWANASYYGIIIYTKTTD